MDQVYVVGRFTAKKNMILLQKKTPKLTIFLYTSSIFHLDLAHTTVLCVWTGRLHRMTCLCFALCSNIQKAKSHASM